MKQFTALAEATGSATEVYAPELFIGIWKIQLRERNSDFSRPPLFVDAHSIIPDAVPGAVVPAVIKQDSITDRAAGTQGEGVAIAVIVKGVKIQVDPIGIGPAVPAADVGADRLRGGVVEAGGQIEGIVVIGHPPVGALPGTVSVVGVVLY